MRNEASPWTYAAHEPGLRRVLRFALYAMLFAIAYFLSARIGYGLAVRKGPVALWPPSGVMLAALALNPRRRWAAIAVGGFFGSIVSDLLSHYPLGTAAVAALANIGESMLAAWVLNLRLGRDIRLDTLPSVLTFAVGAVGISNALTACFGAAMLHWGLHMPLGQAWFVWWVGDGLGMLIVAPVIFTLARVSTTEWTLNRFTVLEGAVLLTLLLWTAYNVHEPSPQLGIDVGPYAAFPLLFWAALRFGAVGASLASLVVAAVVLWNTSHGVGPFVAPGASALHTAFQTYSYLAVASLSSLLIAAMISERAIATKRLFESDERYRAVSEGASDAIITTNARGRIEYANVAATRVFGFTASELIGQDLAVLLPVHLPVGGPEEAMAFIADQKQRGWQVTSLTGRHKAGHDIPFEAAFGELDADDVHFVTVILRDVSERRAAEHALRNAEERMRFALQAGRIGIWDVDLATGVSRWSEELEALHGLSPGTFGGTSQAFVELIQPDDRHAVLEAIERAARDHTDSNILYRNIWPDGSTHWISGMGHTYYSDTGTPLRATGIGFDVTEQRSLEQQLRQSQKMEAIGQLAGGVAHDFNNLLTVITSYSGMLLMELPDDAPSRGEIQEIASAADKAGALTRQLLAFSRQQVLQPQVVDWNEIVRDMQRMLSRVLPAHTRLVTKLEHNLSRVYADPGQLEQVLMNLAVNARDAMPDGGTIVVETTMASIGDVDAPLHAEVKAGSYVVLSVRDTGEGMSAETQARVFEPFFSTKVPGRGTGLGLATVYGIVRQSNGHVWLYSELGRGTVFKVYLPAVDRPADHRTPPTVASLGTRQHETVLLVEDEIAVRVVARRILERAGFVLLEAESATAAVSLMANAKLHIDLLLTDMVMPDMSGRELATWFRARHPDAAVVFMSGYTEDTVLLQSGIEPGMRFLQKPFTPDSLVAALRRALTPAGMA